MPANLWNEAKTQKIFGKKKLLLSPHEHLVFWQTLDLIHADGAINSDQVKKLLQVNHMLTLLVPPLEKIQKSMPAQALTFVDVGCGKSYLSLALCYFLSLPHSQIPKSNVIGFDTNVKVIESARKAASALNLSDHISFYGEQVNISKVDNQRVHAVFALHACDTASDEALAFALQHKADFVAVAPCCQAELCSLLNKPSEAQKISALRAVFTSPQLLREASATWTDALRMSFLGAHGYDVVATEFVPSSHTPKNRLISGRRMAQHNVEKQKEFEELKSLLGGVELKLEKLILEHS